MEKLSTMTFVVFMTLAMLGYLYYGWLLLQTLMSDTTVEFAICFILWLLPLIGLLIFAIEFLREKRK